MLERVLGRNLGEIDISVEKSIVFNPEYKGVRLDVFIRDGNNTHFNVEMQVASRKIIKRARYYHSQIDMELLTTGIDYETLPDTYVIFICDFDPIGLGKYKYTRVQRIEEDSTYDYDDGTYTIFLNTKGKNDSEVGKDLVNFLHFVGSELQDGEKDYSDEFVDKLQKSIERIKESREMGRRYMLFEEMMKDEYNAGKLEGREEGRKAMTNLILDCLSVHGTVSDRLKNQIMSVEDMEVLGKAGKIAAQAQNIEEFVSQFEKLI